MKPFVFTYRSKLSNINPELIKSNLWMVKDGDAYCIHNRKRGEKIGDIAYVGCKTQMYDAAEFIVNELLKKKGLT